MLNLIKNTLQLMLKFTKYIIIKVKLNKNTLQLMLKFVKYIIINVKINKTHYNVC